MGTSDVTALVLAGAANATGAAVALAMWRRHRRRRRALRSGHPSVRPPLMVDLFDTDEGRRIRIGTPQGAPEMAIDIVSFRRGDPTTPWDGEAFVEPLVLRPGTAALLASELDADADVVDVVVAWTARHETGDVQGSRLFRIPSERDDPVPPPGRLAGLNGRAALVLLGLLGASGVVVATSAFDDRPGGDALSDAAATPVTGTTDPAAVTTSLVPTTSVRPTADAPATTMSSPTTTDTTTDTTTSPTSTAATSSTASTGTTAPGEPEVRITGRVEPCRFGDDCLVAGFTIDGFDPTPDEYVCEFDDGSRFTFGFAGDEVETACATGGPTAAITIEVGGVRSETITRP